MAWTARRHGDLGPNAPGDIDARRRAVLDRPWAWLRQVHGAGVVSVTAPPPQGRDADALVSLEGPAALAVFTADCAPIAMADGSGAMAAIHAGWKGLLAGVVRAAADTLRQAGGRAPVAALGPCIGPECYEFSPGDLGPLVQRFGPSVESETALGKPALDLRAAVRASLEEAGVELVFDAGVCTSCSESHWSHRRSADPERQALIVWRP
ncbi:MAG TPA: polyphenol oxidase family protein [Acidimicrobiales bacterium]|nr:polyphenol oxidase family protein [Acidimicrobiales bacterium]